MEHLGNVMLRRSLISCLILAAVGLAADVANMSGTWVLNLKRSKFDSKMTSPGTVILEIQHNEPSLKYSGTVSRAGEKEPTKFEYSGAIDGKQYQAKEDQNTRTIVFRRRTQRSVESHSTLQDGKSKEYALITMSRDGKTLNRQIKFTDPNGAVRQWTEVYEKKQ